MFVYVYLTVIDMPSLIVRTRIPEVSRHQPIITQEIPAGLGAWR